MPRRPALNSASSLQGVPSKSPHATDKWHVSTTNGGAPCAQPPRDLPGEITETLRDAKAHSGGQVALGRLFQELNSGKPAGHTQACPPRPARRRAAHQGDLLLSCHPNHTNRLAANMGVTLLPATLSQFIPLNILKLE